MVLLKSTLDHDDTTLQVDVDGRGVILTIREDRYENGVHMTGVATIALDEMHADCLVAFIERVPKE